MSEPLFQPLAKTTDVTFDHVFMDLVVEDAVDPIENLGLRDPRVAAQDEAFKDSPLASRQRKNVTVDDRISSVEEDPNATDVDAFVRDLQPTANCAAARQYLPHVERLREHVVEA